MGLKDNIDKDTRNMLLIIVGIVIMLLVVYPWVNSSNVLESQLPFLSELNLGGGNFFNGNNANDEQEEVSLIDQEKDYILTVETNKGIIEIDLYEDTAPVNVSSVVNNTIQFEKAEISNEMDDFILFNVSNEDEYPDEINADFLGLDNLKVNEVEALSNLYDPNHQVFKNFSNENLSQYEDLTLKSFYSDIIGYSYSNSLKTPTQKEYMVFKYKMEPQSSKLDLLISQENKPEINGLYTPIGEVTTGRDLLGDITNLDITNITSSSSE